MFTAICMGCQLIIVYVHNQSHPTKAALSQAYQREETILWYGLGTLGMTVQCGLQSWRKCCKYSGGYSARIGLLKKHDAVLSPEDQMLSAGTFGPRRPFVRGQMQSPCTAISQNFLHLPHSPQVNFPWSFRKEKQSNSSGMLSTGNK